MMKKYKNAELSVMQENLQPLLSRKDKLGYIAARNYRIIGDHLIEFRQFRDDLIRGYGKAELDGEGKETGNIVIERSSTNYKEFLDALEPISDIEQEVDLIMAKYEDVIGELSGREIVSIDFMLED